MKPDEAGISPAITEAEFVRDAHAIYQQAILLLLKAKATELAREVRRLEDEIASLHLKGMRADCPMPYEPVQGDIERLRRSLRDYARLSRAQHRLVRRRRRPEPPVSLVVAGLGLAAAGLTSSAVWCVTRESPGPCRGAFPRICPCCVVDDADPVVHLDGLMRSLPDPWLRVVAHYRPASR